MFLAFFFFFFQFNVVRLVEENISVYNYLGIYEILMQYLMPMTLIKSWFVEF